MRRTIYLVAVFSLALDGCPDPEPSTDAGATDVLPDSPDDTRDVSEPDADASESDADTGDADAEDARDADPDADADDRDVDPDSSSDVYRDTEDVEPDLIEDTREDAPTPATTRLTPRTSPISRSTPEMEARSMSSPETEARSMSSPVTDPSMSSLATEDQPTRTPFGDVEPGDSGPPDIWDGGEPDTTDVPHDAPDDAPVDIGSDAGEPDVDTGADAEPDVVEPVQCDRLDLPHAGNFCVGGCWVAIDEHFESTGGFRNGSPAMALDLECEPQVLYSLAESGFHGRFAVRTGPDAWDLDETPFSVARGSYIIDDHGVGHGSANNGAFGISSHA